MNQSPEAQQQGICHTNAECAALYDAISDDLKAPALAMLKHELDPVTSQIRDAHKADPKEWYVAYHFFWGMSVRNLLREKGFGE